jgi:hypothetical protein
MSEDEHQCDHAIRNDPCSINSINSIDCVDEMSNTSSNISVDKQEHHDQESVIDINKVHSRALELCDQFSLDDLEKKCNQLFSDESLNEHNAMDNIEKSAYVCLDQHFTLKRGLSTIKNMYKNYQLNYEETQKRLTKDDTRLLRKMCGIIIGMLHGKRSRITVIQMNNHVPHDTDILSVFRRGRSRNNSKKFRRPIKSILGDIIEVEYAKDLVYVDQDKDNQFTGFICMLISYFKKSCAELGYITAEDWSIAVPDKWLIGIFAIRVSQEDSGDMGVIFGVDNDDEYSAVRIQTYLFNVDKEQSLDKNQYIKFYSGKPSVKGFNGVLE